MMTRDAASPYAPASARPTYPIVLLPPRLGTALEDRPELPPFTQPPPQEEDFPAELHAGKAVASGVLGMFGLKKQAEELLAPARLEARRRYEAALARHGQAKAEFEAEQAAKLTPAAVAAHRRRKVAAVLESSAPESLTESRARMGVSEAHLYERLAHYFPDLVTRRRMLKVGADGYHPDYLLFDPASQLRMDVELDEPYNLRLKAPIHYVDWDAEKGNYLSHDVARDEAFLAAGWVVVRFSEMQAVKDPDGCARVVGDVLERLTGQMTPSLANVKPVQAEPRWTRQDANVMASQDTRQTLLANVQRIAEIPAPPEAKPKKVFKPSENQQRIYDFLLHEDGHGLVVAVAGSGKSTTLLESVKVIKGQSPGARIALMAFNRSIRGELKAKLEDAGFTDVETYTLNGFGNAVIRADKGKSAKLQRNKERGMLNRAARALGTLLSRDDLDKATNLYGKFQSYVRLNPHRLADYQQLAVMYKAKDSDHLQPVVARALDLAAEEYIRLGNYTLDEQNYLPVKLNLPITPYDFVFVDECQDLTQTQLEMVSRAAGEKGRLLFVGDPRQAIMGFRGADNNSVQNIRSLARPPRELPLTVCYRCPKSHTALAQELMPQLQAAPGAKEGQVYELGWEDAFNYVQEGDLLFARTKNLVDWVILELFARGLTLNYTVPKTRSQEDDQGDEELGDSSARVAVVTQQLKAAAQTFKSDQVPRKPELGKYDRPLDALLLWTLGELHKQAQQWDGAEFTAYVDMLTRPDERMGVRVSSAHQSKGLEANRVFVMGYPLFGVPRQGQQPWEYEQELNLKYVALTRARDTLHLVREPEYK